jgi:hypothetical protein
MKRRFVIPIFALLFTAGAMTTVYALPNGTYGYTCNSCHAQSGSPKGVNDTTPPVITNFIIPATSNTLTVPITAFSVTNQFQGVNVQGGLMYLLTESSQTPSSSDANWSPNPPARYTFATEGTKTLYARAMDGALNISSPVSGIVNIALPVANRPPVANAGPDKTVFVRDTIVLDGSGSTDADSNPLTYKWSLAVPQGSTATLSNPGAVTPSFTADRPGQYVAQLVVNDGTVDSSPDTVTITTGNSPPVANAGPDQTASFGDTVNLNGTGSTDVDEDILSYSWAIISMPLGSNAVLSDPTSPTPAFVVDLDGDYTVQLVVNDGTVDSSPDTVTITTGNSAPVAEAGPSQMAAVGDTVNLDGTGSSDVNGDTLSYSWAIISMPSGSTAVLSDPASATLNFVADLEGEYIAQLIVNDGAVDSSPDTITVTVTPAGEPPVVESPVPDADNTCTVYKDKAMEYKSKFAAIKERFEESERAKNRRNQSYYGEVFKRYKKAYNQSVESYENCMEGGGTDYHRDGHHDTDGDHERDDD